jgi:hypothetical protein
MIVNDLDLVRVTISPPKADPPLIVDANTVLPDAIAFELLEAVPRRHPEIVQRFGRVHGDQFAQHRPQELSGIAPNALALEQGFGIPIGEALDHFRS